MTPHIDVPIVHSRHLPASAAVDAARAFRDSGVVDSVTIWDQLTFFAPARLWQPERAPMAAVLPDLDSFPDPYVILSQIAAHVPDIGLTTTSDAVRRGPAELTQTMLTVAGLTEKTLMVHMGAGEAKQCRPFGHKRSQGVGRLEDQFQIFRKFMDSTDPIDHEGNYWTLKNAWIGAERRSRPQLWALGGGPRLIDAATRYADGFCTACPCVWSSPEEAAEHIAEMKTKIAAAGRDPEAFGFGIWWLCLMHDDRAVIEQAKANDYIRWLSVVLGRFKAEDWRKDGVTPPLGEDWHYATKLLPVDYTEDETEAVLAQASPEVIEASWFQGSPKEMAEQLQPWIEAGVNWIQIDDMLPLTRPLEEAPDGARRAIELAGLLKGAA